MSSGDPPRPPTDPPDSPGPKTANRRRPVVRRFSVPFQVQPGDEMFGRLSWIQRFRRDAKSGGAGIIASLFLHAVIVVLMAMIVFQTRQLADGDPLLMTWSKPGEIVERASRTRRPLSIPIEVASTPNRPAEKPVPAIGGSEQSFSPLGVAPVDVSEALRNRNPRLRSANLEQGGGSPDAERAVKAALAWFARNQTSDGHWELHQGYPDAGRSYLKTDTGATALALLGFLGHGDTHQTGEHQQVVARGLKWLQGIQDRTTGDLHDQRQEEGRNAAFYAHSMGTIVLCEALAMTRDDQLRPSSELAVKYLIESQHPDLGGWKYRPLNLRVMSGDISVTAWALMALHSARIAGIEVSAENFERSASFLDRVQAKGGSRYKYEPNEPDSRITTARTAMGLLCRQWLGWPKNHPPMVDGVAFLAEERHRPQWSAGRRNVFEWYYVSQVLHNINGTEWKQWNTDVQKLLVQNQISSGSSKVGLDVRGSWSPRPEGEGEEYSDKSGRLYLTAMCVLILETPYRHRAIYAESH